MQFKCVDQAFKTLMELKAPAKIDNTTLGIIQRFVVLLYDSRSKLTSVNDCRWTLFKKDRAIEAIPPTLDALEQHIKRACLQSRILLHQQGDSCRKPTN